MVTGRVDLSGAGGALEEVVCVLTAGIVVMILMVGPVCGGGDSVVIVVFRGVVAGEVTASYITCAVDGVTGCTTTGAFIPERQQ